MLPRQPLRFLLADDPSTGKAIMAGLLPFAGVAMPGELQCYLHSRLDAF